MLIPDMLPVLGFDRRCRGAGDRAALVWDHIKPEHRDGGARDALARLTKRPTT